VASADTRVSGSGSITETVIPVVRRAATWSLSAGV
jgi:hypothetical protein